MRTWHLAKQKARLEVEAVYQFGGREERWRFRRDVEGQAVHFIEHGQKISGSKSHLGLPTSAANNRSNACSVRDKYKSQRCYCSSSLIVYFQLSRQTAFMDLSFNQGVEHSWESPRRIRARGRWFCCCIFTSAGTRRRAQTSLSWDQGIFCGVMGLVSLLGFESRQAPVLIGILGMSLETRVTTESLTVLSNTFQSLHTENVEQWPSWLYGRGIKSSFRSNGILR